MEIIQTIISSLNPLEGVSMNQIAIRGLFALILVILGVFLGKVISLALKKISSKINLNQYLRGSFVDLFIVIIRWSIYIIFLNIGLNQLKVPGLTDFFTNILILIPALTGALIILSLGFGLAYYVRQVIKNSEIKNNNFVAEAFFYFILVVFGTYALRTALIFFDELVIGIITAAIIGTCILVIGLDLIKKNHSK